MVSPDVLFALEEHIDCVYSAYVYYVYAHNGSMVIWYWCLAKSGHRCFLFIPVECSN